MAVRFGFLTLRELTSYTTRSTQREMVDVSRLESIAYLTSTLTIC